MNTSFSKTNRQFCIRKEIIAILWDIKEKGTFYMQNATILTLSKMVQRVMCFKPLYKRAESHVVWALACEILCQKFRGTLCIPALCDVQLVKLILYLNLKFLRYEPANNHLQYTGFCIARYFVSYKPWPNGKPAGQFMFHNRNHQSPYLCSVQVHNASFSQLEFSDLGSRSSTDTRDCVWT